MASLVIFAGVIHRVLLPWKSGWKNLSVYMEVVYVQFLGKKWNWATGPANAEKLTVNHLHGSSLKEHVQHGSWKTETKNAYVEVTWRSKHQVGNFYVNMFSPHVEYILLGRSLKPPDWPPHHFFLLCIYLLTPVMSERLRMQPFEINGAKLVLANMALPTSYFK